jgi:hypothetical protein
MSKIERLLMPGTTELPDCRCGREMALASTQQSNCAETRIYNCSECDHEMRLIVWLDPPIEKLKAIRPTAPASLRSSGRQCTA